jgi:hypothetical protein
MFALAHERRHKVLLVTLSGVLTSEDLAAMDAALLSAVGRHRVSALLFDLTGTTAVAVPRSKLAQRAQQPPLDPAIKRVVAAPAGELYEIVRAIGEQQIMFGISEPVIVHSLEEASAALGLDAQPLFEVAE